METKMDVPALEAFLEREFPQVDGEFSLIELDQSSILVALNTADRHLRPGGTVSGPSMFALGDVSAYLIVLSRLGPVALAVTTNCSIDFMRKPQPGRLLCRMRLLKLGQSLAVTEGLIFSKGFEEKPVARANFTYSIPS